jgi:hypothetical protein
MTKAKEIRGSMDFSRFFELLNETDPLKKEIKTAFALLKNDCIIGDKIKHNLWPQIYTQKFQITNLWRYRLNSGWRLLYHIVGEPDGFIVYILEALPHDEYEKRFHY